MYVMQRTTHSAELCPSHEPRFRAVMVNWFEKVEATAAKHGVKYMGAYTDGMALTVYALYDTPNMEAMSKFSRRTGYDGAVRLSALAACSR